MLTAWFEPQLVAQGRVGFLARRNIEKVAGLIMLYPQILLVFQRIMVVARVIGENFTSGMHKASMMNCFIFKFLVYLSQILV
ncbi:hypothetical protein SLE2022_112180 [Rubroshorea leprosula]